MAYFQSICVLVVAALLKDSAANVLVKRSDEAAASGFNAFTLIPASEYTYIKGKEIAKSTSCVDVALFGTFTCVNSISNGDYFGFADVDFQAKGAIGIKFRFFCEEPASFRSRVNFFVDSVDDNVPFHTMTIGTTYGQGYWTTVSEYLDYSAVAIGTHSVYLKFEADIDGVYLAAAYIQFF